MMMVRDTIKLAVAIVLGAAFAIGLIAPARAAEFTPQQRKLKGESREKAAVTLVERRKEILDDPESPVGGNPKGDVSVVEFFDYRCPYCKQVMPALDALLAKDKQLRFVYKEFPVLGPDSVHAARAALAARKQGKYEAMHRALMAVKGQLDEAAILKVAASVGLDIDRLKADTAAPEIDQALK